MNSLVQLEDIRPFYISNYWLERRVKESKINFPISPSEQLAGVIADLIGDGHLQEKKWRIDYTSKYKKELRRFGKEIVELFGIKGKIRLCKANPYSTSYNYGINNKVIAVSLHLCGVPSGKKVARRFGIPDWIMNDEIFFTRFISRLLACEGTVDMKSKCIELVMYKSVHILDDGLQFFNQIKEGLWKYFKITCTMPFLGTLIHSEKSGLTTQGIRMKIKRKEAVCLFVEKIGIDNKDKQDRLLKLVKSFQKKRL